MASVAIVSFRLGLSDGVSVVAAAWAGALAELGFTVTTVAGAGPVDHLIPGLAMRAPAGPTASEVDAALARADLVVVENLCTIPLNLPAARVVAEVLRGRPAVLHHHDPPWQRAEWADVTELPPRDPAWRHVTINELTRREMADRGITATTIYNGFDVSPPPGDREGTRAALGIDAATRLVLHPVRVIERKNVPAALALCAAVDATYWLIGPAEDGYGPVLDALLASAPCPVIHRPWPDTNDAYAACDGVVFPSTWEGFGNPPIEAAIRRRPVAIGHYPVAEELRGFGFQWFDPDQPAALAAWLADPVPAVLDLNQRIAVQEFSLERMTAAIAALLSEEGWQP